MDREAKQRLTWVKLYEETGSPDVAGALRKYERLRLAKAARIQGESAANRTRHHLPDGPAQQARDAAMVRSGTDFSPEAVAWLYGFDAGAPEAISGG